jgi:hypothetical protein
MNIAARFCLVLAAVAGSAPAAMAQVESHCLPTEMPAVLFPTWVTTPPHYESQEVSAPLAKPPPRSLRAPEGNDGRPDALSVADMLKEPRDVIQAAEAGKFQEAAKAGEPILNQARERYRDYTWDYLGNAVAWSFIQTGDLKKAAQAHLLAATRLDDEGVADYHRAAARMLTQTSKSATELKNASAYQAELRTSLVSQLEAFKYNCDAAKKAAHPVAYMKYLLDAYGRLRMLAAADPDVGRKDALAAFGEAAHALASNVIPGQLTTARYIQKTLDEKMAGLIHGREFDEWNGTVQGLWSKVQDIKRLCRMYDYMSRLNLTGPASEATRLCIEAHNLLFVPGKGGLVWQELGRTRTFNDVSQIDLRAKVPWQETDITPWGVGPLAQKQVPQSWNPVDGKMDTIDGKMTPMNGKMHPIGRPPK